MQKHGRNLSFVLLSLLCCLLNRPRTMFLSIRLTENIGKYIKEWLVLGPFFRDDLEKDFLVDSGGEANIEPIEGETVVTAQGDTLTWKRYQTNGSSVDLLNVVGNYEHATAYAFYTLKSNVEGKNQILLGSDD